MIKHLNKVISWASQKTGTNVEYAVKSTFWWTVGKISSVLGSIAIMLAFANFVPKEIFGSYKYILSFVSIAALATLPGLNSAIVRAIAKGKEGMLLAGAKARNSWSLIGVAGLLIVAAYYHIKGNMILGGGFVVASVFLPFKRTADMFTVLWHGRMDFRKKSILETIGNFLPAIAITLTVFLSDNLWVIILSYFGSYSLVRGSLFLYSVSQSKNNEKDEETIGLGKHMTWMAVGIKIAGQADKLLLWHLLGPVALAVFSFSQMPIGQIKDLLPIQALSLPKLSKGSARDKKTTFKHLLVIGIASVAATIGAILLLPLAYQYLFPQYLESVRYAQILSLSILFMPFSYLTARFVSQNQIKELYILKLLIPLVKVTLLVILIPMFGILGAVFGIVVNDALTGLIGFGLYLKNERRN
jgi:O-antigen/teichoic acid export membrane protein